MNKFVSLISFILATVSVSAFADTPAFSCGGGNFWNASATLEMNQHELGSKSAIFSLQDAKTCDFYASKLGVALAKFKVSRENHILFFCQNAHVQIVDSEGVFSTVMPILGVSDDDRKQKCATMVSSLNNEVGYFYSHSGE